MAVRAKKIQPAKAEAIENAKKAFADYSDFIFADYRGLTVEKITALRDKLREKNAVLKVVKNNFGADITRNGWINLDKYKVVVPAAWKKLTRLIGTTTLDDIISSLKQPERDLRDKYPQPVLRSDILHIEDLKKGDKLQGTVRNVVDFGLFIDIGLKNDGLAHISKLFNEYLRHP